MSLPKTFYLVYQGYDDSSVMADISAIGARLFPQLVHSVAPTPTLPRHPSPLGGGGENVGGGEPKPSKMKETGRVRVGFVSAYLYRSHPVCKLFCGVLRRLVC